MAAEEAKTTRFLIYEADDEEGLGLRLAGAQQAKGADEALRAFYAEPPDEKTYAAAVSENQFRIRPIKAREPKVTIGEPIKVGGRLRERVGGTERVECLPEPAPIPEPAA